MEITYKREYNESYMIIEGELLDTGYEETMLRKNMISSLLKFYTMEINGKMQFWYEITGKESLQSYMEQNRLDLQMFDMVITYLAIAYREISKYLLAQNHIKLQADTIYIDRSSKNFQLYLCYCPIENADFTIQFRHFMEYLLTVIDHQDEVLTKISYQLYEYALTTDYHMENIADIMKHYVMDLSEDEKDTANHHGIISTDEKIEKEKPQKGDIYDKDCQNETEIEEYLWQPQNWQERIKERVMECLKKLEERLHMFHKGKEEIKEYADVVVEPEPQKYEPTVYLKTEEDKCSGLLKYMGNQEEEDYLIQQEVFYIGSREEKNDANLHSRLVSRHHAKIVREEEAFYIEDLNSTNGTYLNGEPLNYRERIRLQSKDTILFADVPYCIM